MENATVLTVDDNATNLLQLRAILEDAGYEVLAADSGEAALQIVKKSVPSLILLDILMPELDGYETCRRIKALPQTADAPVIFISSQEEVSEKVKAFESGGVDYITKPFQSEEIVARVRTHLNLYLLQKHLQEKNEELKASRKTILQQQHEMALQSRSATMGEILSLIAHHWRQPLSVISTIATNVLLKKEFDALDDTYLEEAQQRIIDHVQALSKVIDDFKDFFKHDDIAETPLRNVLYKARSLTECMLKNHKTVLHITDSPLLDVALKTYLNELIQVHVAIIINAVEALALHPARARHVTVTVQQPESGRVRICIADNGGGIPAEAMDEIFLPYYSTKERKVGTGLGLYMSKMVIERHCKGRLTVQNEADGALFTLDIPTDITTTEGGNHGK